MTIPYLTGWEPAAGILAEEVQQLVEEGRDPAWIENYLRGIAPKRSSIPDGEVWQALQAAPLRPDFTFHEPDGLEEIRAARPPAKMRVWPVTLSNADLQDRILGAWLGRCCGCALGKPVESFMPAFNGLSSRERTRTYLLGAGPHEYPLNNYIPSFSSAAAQTGPVWCEASRRENIAFMETDDDIRYTVLAQQVLMEKGAAFTTADVMKMWIRQLPYELVCTAETQAYRNYIMRYHVRAGKQPEDIDWAWVATHQNPYREWIGAQIRADSWGYAAPGRPELAADFGWRDARMSHVKNGIYGEMFVAAMIAAGVVLREPLAVIEAGLAEIPAQCRLARDIRLTIELCASHGNKAGAFEAVFQGIYELLDPARYLHTNNNAALVVAALLLGGDDFEKVIALAVMGGWDTDCNGATAGSIFGVMHGSRAIPSKWKDPLHDTLYSQISGYHPIAISEGARRSFELAKTIGAASV